MKEPLFTLLRDELKGKPQQLADQTWLMTKLLDKLGLYTAEVYAQSRKTSSNGKPKSCCTTVSKSCPKFAANRSPFFTTLHHPPQLAGFRLDPFSGHSIKLLHEASVIPTRALSPPRTFRC